MHLSFQFFFNSILLGVGLAMDAFSVSLANGLNEPHMSRGKMTNSVSWAKMQAASVGRRRGEELDRWRQEQLAEITRQNEAIRAEARAKKAAQGLARTPK